MVTLPGGRFWSFCCCAAVFGVITLKPDATSMLSLFCVLVCVVAQPNKSAVHAAMVMASKICLDDSIGCNLVVDNKIPDEYQKVIPVVICGPCMTASKRKLLFS